MSTVIVVEDDITVLEITTKILETRSFEVIPFNDAEPVLNYSLDGIDLIITDLGMPTPGEKLIKTLRARGEQIPIVVMSGHLHPDQDEQIKAMGVQEVILKPFSINGLLSAIRNACDQKVYQSARSLA